MDHHACYSQLNDWTWPSDRHVCTLVVTLGVIFLSELASRSTCMCLGCYFGSDFSIGIGHKINMYVHCLLLWRCVFLSDVWVIKEIGGAFVLKKPNTKGPS
jgi:hypothetical protein